MTPEELASLNLLEARRVQSRVVKAPFPKLTKWARSMGWYELVKVPLKPESGMLAGQCFDNVARKVAQDGGRVEYGHLFVLVPDQAIQTTSHAIWVSPKGERIDITQMEYNHVGDHVLFAPDPSVVKKKGASPSHYCLLSTNPKIR
jgi:hypothetical protein